MVFAKLKELFFEKLSFSRQFFLLRKISLFQNTKKSFGGKKINLAKKFFNLAKKVGPFKISSFKRIFDKKL
jgi:hypothetical protein